MTQTLPAAARPLVRFPAILRDHGFVVSPDQTIGFVQAVGLLGPRGIGDIHAAGLAMLAIPHERQDEYDALFRAFFLGQSVQAPALGDEEDELQAHEPDGGQSQVEADEDQREAGAEATGAERLSHAAR